MLDPCPGVAVKQQTSGVGGGGGGDSFRSGVVEECTGNSEGLFLEDKYG